MPILLCYAMLCYTTLCYTTLCYAMLRYATLCYRCAVPIVLESAKLVVAEYVRAHSEHVVAIRESRDGVLSAVKKDFGVRFTYWKLGPMEMPKASMA